jgi:hypothetical protein
MEKDRQETLEAQPTNASSEPSERETSDKIKRPWYMRLYKEVLTPGSAAQIVLAAAVAIAIGMAVTANVDEIPEAVPIILEIPGMLWLRALRATGMAIMISH